MFFILLFKSLSIFASSKSNWSSVILVINIDNSFIFTLFRFGCGWRALFKMWCVLASAMNPSMSFPGNAVPVSEIIAEATIHQPPNIVSYTLLGLPWFYYSFRFRKRFNMICKDSFQEPRWSQYWMWQFCFPSKWN